MPEQPPDAAPGAIPKERVLRRALRLLRQSWRAHVERPATVVLLLAVCVALFLFDTVTGHRDPTAGDLSKLFAPAPLDAFTGIRLADGSWWRLAPIIAIRAAFVVVILSMLTRRRATLSSALKVGALQLAATLAFVVPVLIGSFYFVQKAAALESPGRWAGALALLGAAPVVFLLLTVVFAPLVCSAAIGEKVKLRLNDGAIWILAAISTWLWLFGFRRVDAVAQAPSGAAMGHGVAFVVLLLQSVIVGAIAMRTIEALQAGSIRKASSSVAAEASAAL